jgi:excisionase family DNA binding protein
MGGRKRMNGLAFVQEPSPAYETNSPEATSLPKSINKYSVTYFDQRVDGIFDYSYFALWQGTGSLFRHEDLIGINSSGPYTSVLKFLPCELPPYSAFVSPGRMLATIKSELSVTITEMAGLLGVERPTLYSWIAEERSPHPSNRNRLDGLYEVAMQWKKKNNGVLGNFRNYRLASGQTLLDLLKASPLPIETIGKEFDALSTVIDIRKTGRKSSSQELIEKYGIKARPKREEIDFITGKRLGEE